MTEENKIFLETGEETGPKIKEYKKRWLILFIFSYVSFFNAFNWIEYNIIQDVTIAFYNESLPSSEIEQKNAVNWFSMSYMICFIPLVFPATFLLDRKGLRCTIILGSALLTIGSVIKCFAIRPDLFHIAMIGQVVCAVAESITLSVPSRLAALWFGPTQIGLATSIGVFGNQLGIAAGFLIPPNLVTLGSLDFMKQRFSILLITAAVLSFIGFILSLIFIKDEPDLPPSMPQANVRRQKLLASESEKSQDLKIFMKSLFALLSNFNFLLILFSYGINVGVFYAISTLLNPIISEYYKDANSTIGFFGLIIVLAGSIGSIIAGLILDKSKKFKGVTILFYLGSFLSMILFTVTLNIHIGVIFGTSALLGFFMTGYLPVGFELATEITYPESEGTSCGLLNQSSMAFGLVLTYSQNMILSNYGSLYGNIFLCVILFIGSIISMLIKSDLRRQRTENQAY